MKHRNTFVWSIKSRMRKKRPGEAVSESEVDGGAGEGKDGSLETGEDDKDDKVEIKHCSLNAVLGEGLEEGSVSAVYQREDVQRSPEIVNMDLPARGGINAQFYSIDLSVISGQNLIPMDKGGTSDPYFVILHEEAQLYRSTEIKKTTNPVWDERTTLYFESPLPRLLIKVYDKDVVGKDDYLGEYSLNTEVLPVRRVVELAADLELGEQSSSALRRKARKRDGLGTLYMRVHLQALTKQEYYQSLRSQKEFLSARKLKPTGVVHILLVQARSVTAMDGGISSDPYCKVSLGKEKGRTRVMDRTLNPKWREAVDLFWFEELTDYLEIQLFDHDVGGKDDYLGRVDIDLRELTHEVSHNLWREIQEGQGHLNVIVTISGTSKQDSPSNLQAFQMDQKYCSSLVEKYRLSNSFFKMKDVGRLIVKVLKAEGLQPADIGGASDPFAVLELVNDRVQTDTKYKTLTPTWQKIFVFDVKDINDILEVTVYDEDKDHKYEFLGKVMIPLLRIQSGQKKWLNLKDRSMRRRAKGNSPRILLELWIFWNPIRASIRTFNPKQTKYEDTSDIKFKFSTFNKNVQRVKAATAHLDPELLLREVDKILNWQNKIKSTLVFIGFMLGVWFFQPWMISFGLLIPFIQNLLVRGVVGSNSQLEEEDDTLYQDDALELKRDEDDKRSLKEKMQAIQDIALKIQGHLGFLAHLMESLKNIFNFSVPFLSWLAFIVLALITLILYYVPLRVLLMAWGINKFTKKLIRPWAINNNELADFISRVPDNEELKDHRELGESDEIDRKILAKLKKNAARDADII